MQNQRIVLIKGGSRAGKSFLSKALARMYELQDLRCKRIVLPEQSLEEELNKLKDFHGYILVESPLDDLPIAAWQTIEISGRGNELDVLAALDDPRVQDKILDIILDAIIRHKEPIRSALDIS